MTIALICMVLFDMLITQNAGGHSLTQVMTCLRKDGCARIDLFDSCRKLLYQGLFGLVIENVEIYGLYHHFVEVFRIGLTLHRHFLLY